VRHKDQTTPKDASTQKLLHFIAVAKENATHG